MVILLDKDIVENINSFDCGVRDLMVDNVNWLLKQVAKCLLTHREDIRSKNPGALANEITRVIWIPMLTQPIMDNNALARIWHLRRKFNLVLQDLLQIEWYMHYLPIERMEEAHYFDHYGNLTSAGKKAFWLNFDKQFKELDYSLARQETKFQFSRKLPTPPPRRNSESQHKHHHNHNNRR